MEPKRIQRKRTRGFKLPENTVCVTRGTKWGNPFKVGAKVPVDYIEKLNASDHFHFMKFECGYVDNAHNAVALFKAYVLPHLDVAKLKGKNLACFCALDKPCHADILLAIANE